MLPPPGAGLSLAVSLAKATKFMSINFFDESSCITYSMIFFFGSNGVNSSNPILFTAIFINSSSLIPTLLCCFTKKYFPASSIDFRGTKPTNSLPVTLIPLACARSTAASNAMCKGVMLMFVRFIEICAIPYSSINQPIAFTLFNKPGSRTSAPLASNTFFPFSSFTRPFSRRSNATELARRVEVVFKFTL